MDGWVEKLVAGKGHHQVLVAGHGLETKKIQKAILSAHAENDDHHHAHDQHHHDHGSNDMDPHVWLDPLLAQNIVRRMADSMVEIAPQHSVSVFARRDIFLNELQELHEEFTKNLENVSRREVVTFHGAFAYLFARYKLETVGVVEQFPGDEPSAAYLRELVDLMRELKMKVIFAEPQLPERPAQVIAQEIGGRVERLDPCETILSEAPHATYLERQRANLETLRRTLSEP
jgi:zinc transport system substrate-binding protein